MKRWPLLIFFIILLPSLLACQLVYAQDKKWQVVLGSGIEINAKQFYGMIKQHSDWLRSSGRWGKKANFTGAKLVKVNLSGMTLGQADFDGATLDFCQLSQTDFQDAKFTGATFISCQMYKAIFCAANLSGSRFYSCPMKGVTFSGANATKTEFYYCSLNKANCTALVNCEIPCALHNRHTNGIYSFKGGEIELKPKQILITTTDESSGVSKTINVVRTTFNYSCFENCDLSEAIFWGANLEGARISNVKVDKVDFSFCTLAWMEYDPRPGSVPLVTSLIDAQGLQWLQYDTSPQGLYALRQAARKAGFRYKDNELTFAVMRNERLKTYDPIWKYVTYAFFEWPCGWGCYFLKPSLILLLLIPLFTIIYFFLFIKSKRKQIIGVGKNGFYRVWMSHSKMQRGDRDRFDPLYYGWDRWYCALSYAFYFSILSAFHIGWRELNLGTWLSRMQLRRYRILAIGWARLFSALQSLISVYLLALALLTWFSHPFG